LEILVNDISLGTKTFKLIM